eukprot:CAMPEP_0170555938 /NCGR_PEP_ID=MMETSP0211-20121228/14773_1 /TAXON_ID=311385 /ORGANISM="Pseudokeronopsis sp., Strain OXSARD2" /LENGTH=72 /DNA_ID=CAMNT_0010865975 /DNA_START=24 /DNA_END=242 /DNA_ORIENTATION=-
MASEQEQKLDAIVEEVFAKYDKNKDNALQKDELKSFLHDKLKDNGLESHLNNVNFDEVFKGYDKDANDEVSK